MSEGVRSRMCGKGLAGLIGVFVLTALVVPQARATYNPIAGGATKVKLDRSFLGLLEQNGVKLSAAGGARLTAGTVTFPISAGKLDPVASRGTVEHDGTLVFRAGTRRIALRALLLKTTRPHAPLSVKVGGGQLKLAQTKGIAVVRRGFGSEIRIKALQLSSKVATRLGKKLGLRGVFEPGQPLGSSVTRAIPSTIAVEGKGRVDLDLDPGFVAKLQSLFVAVNPIFPAEHPGSFTLPIFGGTLAPDASEGRVATQGALEFLQLGGGQVFWREPELEFGSSSLVAEVEVDPSPPYGGKLGPLTIGSLTSGSVSAKPATRTISQVGVMLSLDAVTAATFNEVFAKPQGKDGVFVAGETAGTLGFTAQGE